MTIIIHIPGNKRDRENILEYIQNIFPQYTFKAIIDYDKYNKFTISTEEDISKKEVKKIIEQIKNTSLHFYDEEGYVYN